MDFATGLVSSVLNLPNRQVKFGGEFKLQKICNQSHSSNFFFVVGGGEGGGGASLSDIFG